MDGMHSTAGRRGPLERLPGYKKRGGNPGPYKKGSGSKKKAKRVEILPILVVTLAAVLVISLLFTHIGIKNFLPGRAAASRNGENSLILNQKPGNLSKQFSAEQVADKILPCVVGVIQYQLGAINETGEGSGIIMSSDGKIITNNHVVEDAAKIEVVTHGGKKYEAMLIGRDVKTDLAVIQIHADHLPYAQFGDSSQCRVGEQVLAVGNPSGLQLAGSVTQGIISALNRQVSVGNGPMRLIQTDAAINPGNSGGALVNMFGQVVGINSAKIEQTGYEGLGFSIPVNVAKPVVDSILKYGYVKGRVKFGFSCRDISEVTAGLNGIPTGILIESVEKGSNVEANGLKAGDIITAVDSVAVDSTEKMVVERNRHKPGDVLTLSVYRRSDKKDLVIRAKLLEDRGTVSTAGGDW